MSWAGPSYFKVRELARHTRYQGAIIKDHRILLIVHKQRSTGRAYWVIPGGGIEGSESEEECVIREMKEETNLDVTIDRLVFDEPAHPDSVYEWRKTFTCHPVSGEASPGYEPEPDAAANYSISEVRWFDLRDEVGWDDELCQDPYTYPQLVRLREVLGYTS
jgi:8-oxo-dGTP pyrophosphatase MutT (NUDIX family)